MDICEPLWIFAGRYGSVTRTSSFTVYVITEIVVQHRHYRAILIVINFIMYKLCIFSPPLGFKFRLPLSNVRIVLLMRTLSPTFNLTRALTSLLTPYIFSRYLDTSSFLTEDGARPMVR